MSHSPVCSTLRIALRKIVNNFNELGGGGGLGCSWFQRGTGRLELRALTAWGKKLLSNLTELALILRYLLPDGRSWKRLWEGWVGSFTMLEALLEHHERKMSRMKGRGAPMIFAAVFTVRCRVLQSAALQFPYQTVMQAGQHTLNGAPVESGEDGWRETCPFQPAEKVEALLSLLVEWHDVDGPGEILCNVHPQEFSAADSLHGWAVDGQWGVVNRVSPEVHHNLFCLTRIEGQVVSTTPFSQLCHFLSVVRFIVVSDEAYHSCVISKLDDVVGAGLGSAVVSQQREKQRAEHTSLVGHLCSVW